MVIIPQMYSQTKCDGSFVKLSSEEVKARSLESLKQIRKEIKAATQHLIDDRRQQIEEERKHRRNSIWYGFLNLFTGDKEDPPMPTDEEILHDIEHDCPGDYIHLPETYWIDLRYDKYRDVAYRLYNAASHADEIYVSTSDLEMLLRYKEEDDSSSTGND